MPLWSCLTVPEFARRCRQVSLGLALGVLLTACGGSSEQGVAAPTLLASVSAVFGAAAPTPPPTIAITIPQLAGAIGEQKIAVLLVSFPSTRLLSAVTPALLQATFFGPGNSVDSFLREVSYGKTWASGKVFDPIVLDADYLQQPYAVRDAAVKAVSEKFDLSSYNRIVLVVPQSSAGLVSGGEGTRTADRIALANGATLTATTSWLGDASMASPLVLLGAACHEMGHNLGLDHARAADFGDEPLGPVGQLPKDFDQTHDYGDLYSNMGRDLGHWAAPHKAALGWLVDGVSMAGVESAGSVQLLPYESAAAGLKALRVRRGSGNDAWVWLEYRQPAAGNFDAALPSNAGGVVLLHYEDASWDNATPHTNLLRMNADGLFFGNAPLAKGSSWSDPYSNLTISVVQADAAGAQVSIAYGAAPTISMAPTAARVAGNGGTLSLAVTAGKGTAWSAQSSATWLTIASATSGNGPGNLTVAAAVNPNTTPRWAKIAIGAAMAIVTQDGSTGDVSLAPLSASYPASGGAGEIVVSSGASDYAWAYTPADSWIQDTFFTTFNWTGPGVLRYTVAQNTSTLARSTKIGIGNKTFVITQAAGSPLVSRLRWDNMVLADAPISRMGMSMVIPPLQGDAILFGGNFDSTVMDDTWGWNGSSWTRKNPVAGPGARTEHAMAYDAARNQVVLFGGATVANPGGSDDTWIWDGTNWRMVPLAVRPPARYRHSMVYNPLTQKILLFGGTNGVADTWEWDGSSWTQKITKLAPAARVNAAMAYDAARNEIVLFGGVDNQYTLNPTYYNDTWTWDGSSWTQKTTATSPAKRWGAVMAYHPELGQLVMVGGSSEGGAGTATRFFSYREETWTWDGADWTQQFPDNSPEFSWAYGVGYSAAARTFYTYLGDDLHCAVRGPHMYVLKPGSGAIVLDSYRAEHDASGGSGSVAISAGVAWNVRADGWITLKSATSGSGNASLSYDVAPNVSTSARNGRIVIGDKVLTIAQAGEPVNLNLGAALPAWMSQPGCEMAGPFDPVHPRASAAAGACH